MDERFLVNLGAAIQAYAGLEQALFLLFSRFSGTAKDVAGVIFFKITAARARDDILEKLLEIKYGNRYSVFWKSFASLINVVSGRRNEIVHWIATTTTSQGFFETNLLPPSFWTRPMRTGKVSNDDLVEFAAKCRFICELCGLFQMELSQKPEAPPLAWRDIFQQPVVYPPPSTHPLYKKPKEPENQPPPSPPSPPQ
jgi:hypothetical protein